MSMPLPMGLWRMGNGERRRMTFWAETGHLTIDGDGGLDLLAVCHDEDDLRRRLAGWAEHCDLRDGLGWVAQQLEGCR